MSERAFLDAIIAEPDEDAHRLVFADWLDDHGQPDRAEFIRTQCALARLPDDDPHRAELEARERCLLAAHAPEWADPCPRFQNWEYAGDGPFRAEFRRGFLEAVDLRSSVPEGPAWGEGFGRLLAAHPIREVDLGAVGLGMLWRLAGREELGRIESLSVAQWGDYIALQRQLLQEVHAFLGSPRLGRVRRLAVHFLGVTGERALAWLGSPAFGRAEAVNDPTSHPADGQFLRGLAQGGCPNLRELHLYGSNLPTFDQAAEELIGSSVWPRLRSLTLPASETFPWAAALANGRLQSLVIRGGYHQPGTALVTALASASGPATLEELVFQGQFCHGERLSAVLASAALAKVRRLAIQYGNLTDDDLERLASSPLLANLTRLDLVLDHHAGTRGLVALFGSARLGRLTHLSIHGGNPSSASIEALARNPACRRLRVLAIHSGSAAALRALTQGEPFPELHTLHLGWHRPAPSPAVLDALLRSPKFPRLCVVPFCVDAGEVNKLEKVFRACDRIAWAGGEMADGGDGVRVAVKPETVYLPNHLAEV